MPFSVFHQIGWKSRLDVQECNNNNLKHIFMEKVVAVYYNNKKM